MKWTVVQLQQTRGKAFEFDEYVDVETDLKRVNPEIRKLSPVHVTGSMDIDSRKISVQLHIAGEFILPCSRTLEDVTYPVNIESRETFLLNPLDHEDGDLEESHEIQGGIIDLMPIIQELLLLEIPMQVFSDHPIEQAAMTAGKGWEVKTEEQLLKEKENKIDPRLAELAKLFDSKNE